eukprot:GFKZ01012496.1.p1 GENE.GFKZ01012496.1~~GFKZ01012496.1.p1  ORF type:complete len:1045 (-),score=164.64 GFKZ01012496.1:2467-5490(-)
MTSHPPTRLDDMIVSQIEWYLGRVNLEGDVYLKSRMDPDSLWVDLSVILDFPKMQRMAVRDMNHVAHLLASRSAIVEVDPHNHRIRPAWAFRSTLVISDVPTHATHDDLLHLLHTADLTPTPPPASDSMSTSATHTAPPVLLSVDPLTETKWIVVYDTPHAAQLAHAQLNHSTIKGVQIRTEPHMERAALRLPSQNAPHPAAVPTSHPSNPVTPIPASTSAHNHSPSPSAATYPRNNSHNPYMHHPDPPSYPPHLNQIMMHVPVMHPGSAHDVHGGYPYPSYVPSYVNVGVHRGFLPPRGMGGAGGGYMVPYGSGVPYDAPGGMVGGGMQSVPTGANVDSGNGHAVGNGTGLRSGDGAKGSAGGAIDNATGNLGADVVEIEGDVDKSTERFVSNMSVAPDLAAGAMAGQSKADELGTKEVDGHHYHHHPSHRGAMADGGFGRGGSGRMGHHQGHHYHNHHHSGGMHRGDRGNMQRGSGDGGRGGTSRGGGSNGGGMDMQGRGPTNRKGRKGNRNNSNGRHVHHGDRHVGDGRGHDGKGDGVGSPRDKDDRRSSREEKPKPEPNLNSMHFPPLPAANDAATQRVGQAPVIAGNKSSISKKDNSGNGNGSAIASKEGVELNGTLRSGTLSDPESVEVNEKNQAQSAADSDTLTSTDPDLKKALTGGTKQSNEAIDNGTTKVISSSDGKNSSAIELNKRSSVSGKKGSQTTGNVTNGSARSYAEILCSPKPASPRATTPSQRPSSQSSSKAVEAGSGTEAVPNGHQPAQQTQQSQHGGKDRNNSRRRKGNNNSKNAIGNEPPSVESPKNNGTATIDVGHGKREDDTGNGEQVKDQSTKESDSSRAKIAAEVAPAHSAWANAPKSLFQPAAVVPSRSSSLNTEVRKTSSPVSSTEGDAAREKIPTENQSTLSHGGDNDSTVTGSNVSAGDCSTNGAEVPDISHLSIEKGAKSLPHAMEVPSGASTPSKKFSSNSNGNPVMPRGAWAAGGPKAWQKTTGNGVSERTPNTSES